MTRSPEPERILAANPNSPKANKLVGVVLLDQQKPADALPYFKKALDLPTNDPLNEPLITAFCSRPTRNPETKRSATRNAPSCAAITATANTPSSQRFPPSSSKLSRWETKSSRQRNSTSPQENSISSPLQHLQRRRKTPELHRARIG